MTKIIICKVGQIGPMLQCVQTKGNKKKVKLLSQMN